jgi:hypothetical protein
MGNEEEVKEGPDYADAPVTPAPDNPGHVYLRLLNIYRGDIAVSGGKVVDAILFHCEDIPGKQYLMPVYVPPNLMERALRSIRCMKPLVFADQELDEVGKDEPTQDLHNINQEKSEGEVTH